MASSSGSRRKCANIDCEKAIEVPRPGWSTIGDRNAKLCNACFVAFSTRQFCDIYHKNNNRWCFCPYCDKKFHEGCIVSRNWYRNLGTGGIICSICATKEAILIPYSKGTMDNCNPTTVEKPAGERSSRRPSRGKKVKYPPKPRTTNEELIKEITECSNANVTLLFEKMLTASDTRRNGRLVVPKKCAEDYFPSCDDSEARSIIIQDVKGKKWYFHFKYWPNNNSRIYVLEGFYRFVKSMRLRVGDTVTFGMSIDDGKLVMGYRKSASTSSRRKKGKMVKVTTKTQRAKNDKNISQEVEETRESPIGSNVHLVESPIGSNVHSIMVAEPKGFKIKSNKSMAKAGTSSEGKAISATRPSLKKCGTSSTGKRVENEYNISEVDLTSEEDTELVRSPHLSIVPSVVVDKEVEIKSSKGKEVSKDETTPTKLSIFSKWRSKDLTSVQSGAERKFSQIGPLSVFNQEKQSNEVKARDHVDGKRKTYEIGSSVKSPDNQNKRSEVDLTSKHAQELVCSPCDRNDEIKSSKGMVKAGNSSEGKTTSAKTQPMKKRGIGLNRKRLEYENKRSEVDLVSEKAKELERSPRYSNVPSVMVDKEVEIKTSKVSKGKITSTKNSTFSKGKSKDPSSVQLEAKGKHNQIGKLSIFREEKQKGPISVQSADNEKAKVDVDAERKHNQIGALSITSQEKRKDPLSVQSDNGIAKAPINAKRKYSQTEKLSIFNEKKRKDPLSVRLDNGKAKAPINAKRKYRQTEKLSIFSEEKQKSPIRVISDNEKAKAHVDAKRKSTLWKSSQETQKRPIHVESNDGKAIVPIDANKKSCETGYSGKSTATQNKRSKVDLTSKHDQELFFASSGSNVGFKDSALVEWTNIFAMNPQSTEELSAKTVMNISPVMGQGSSNKLQKGNVEPEPVETRVTTIENLAALPASPIPIKKRPSYRPIECTDQLASGVNHNLLCKFIKPTEEGNYNPNHQMMTITTQPRNVEPLSLNSSYQMLVNSQPNNIQKPAEPESSNANQNTTLKGSSRDEQKVKKMLCDLNLPPEDEDDEEDIWTIKLTYNGP